MLPLSSIIIKTYIISTMTRKVTFNGKLNLEAEAEKTISHIYKQISYNCTTNTKRELY